MHILNLLEAPFQTNYSTKTLNSPSIKDYHSDSYIQSKNLLGDGLRSNVFADPNDPHLAMKSSKYSYAPHNHDGFKIFIEYLYNNNLLDNPHFPRIYDIKVFKDKEGYHIEKYRMERLTPPDQISPEIMESYVRNIITKEYEDYISEEEDVDFMTLAALIGHAATSSENPFKLKELNEACKILQKISKETKAPLDLHGGNIMFRRGSFGIQVVIIDPLY